MDIVSTIKKLMASAVICYHSKCKDHDSGLYALFEQKGFVLGHVVHKTLTRVDDPTVKLDTRVLVMTISEFAKLHSHCPRVLSYITLTSMPPVHVNPVVAIMLLGQDMVDFDYFIESSMSYVHKDTKRLTDTLNTANDTIKQLRLELKGFRSMKKKERKRNAIPPPAYIDEHPPGF
jgi:hypothetical protein